MPGRSARLHRSHIPWALKWPNREQEEDAMRYALISTLVVLASWLAGAVEAEASSYDPVASGTVRIPLSASFAKLLASHHVSVEPRGGAKRKGRKIVLTAVGGEF